MEKLQETKEWAAKKFGILPEEVVWYNFGICYDRVAVTTKEAADKVSESVKGQYVNGGMFDGMRLGGQSLMPTNEYNIGDPYYDIYC